VICPFSSETWIYASDLSHWNVKGEIIAVFHGDAAYLLLNEIVMFKPVSLLVVTESWSRRQRLNRSPFAHCYGLAHEDQTKAMLPGAAEWLESLITIKGSPIADAVQGQVSPVKDWEPCLSVRS
jgi:hypothetical protein